MSVYWDPAADPIMSDDELTHECADERECEICGSLCERLHEAADDDPSVGYHGTVLVCDNCIEKARRRR